MYKRKVLDYDMVFSNGLLIQSWEESWPDYRDHRLEKEKLLKRGFISPRVRSRLYRCDIHINTYESKYGIGMLEELFRVYRDKKEIPPEPESLFTYVREASNKTEEDDEEIEFAPLDDEPIKTSEELDAEKVAAESKEVEAVQVIDVTMPAGTGEEEDEEQEEGDDRDEDNKEGTEDGSGVDLRLVEKEGSDRNIDSVDNEPATDDGNDGYIAGRENSGAETEAEEEPVCDSAAGESTTKPEPFPNLEPVEDEEDWWRSDYAEPTEEVVTEDSGRDTTVPATQKPDAEDKKSTEGEQIDVGIEPEDMIDVEGEKFSKKYLISLYEENGVGVDFNKLSLLEIHFLEEDE